MADGEALAGRAEQDLLVGDEPAEPHRVDVDAAGPAPPRAPPTTSCLVGSGAQSGEAAAMRCTVIMAVPDGASALVSWCSSITSAVSKNGAASSAKRIISTAPMAKFGATRQLLAVKRLGQVVEVVGARSPVVPITAWTPWAAHHAAFGLGRAGDGEVDGDLGARLGQRARLGGDRDALDDLAGVGRIDGGDQLQLGVGGDRGADRAPPSGRRHRTPPRGSSRPNVATGPRPPSLTFMSRTSATRRSST